MKECRLSLSFFMHQMGSILGCESLKRISKKCVTRCLVHSGSSTNGNTFLPLPLFERLLSFLLLPFVLRSFAAHGWITSVFITFPAVTSLQQLPTLSFLHKELISFHCENKAGKECSFAAINKQRVSNNGLGSLWSTESVWLSCPDGTGLDDYCNSVALSSSFWTRCLLILRPTCILYTHAHTHTITLHLQNTVLHTLEFPRW